MNVLSRLERKSTFGISISILLVSPLSRSTNPRHPLLSGVHRVLGVLQDQEVSTWPSIMAQSTQAKITNRLYVTAKPDEK